MGDLTRSEFRDELQYLLEGRNITNVRMNRWINRAYEQVCYPTIHRHWELEGLVEIPLVNGQFEYSLSPTETYIDWEILGIRSARYVQGTADSYIAVRNVLNVRSIGFFNRQRWTTISAGPSYYGVYRNNLIVAPGPDASIAGNIIALEVWRKPAALTTDTDTTLIPDWWDEVILIGAKWLAESELGYLEYATETQRLYQAMLASAPNRDLVGVEDDETAMMDMTQAEHLQDMG